MISGTPRYTSYGAEDLSSVREVREKPVLGATVLKSIIYASKGPKIALVNGSTISDVFGDEIFTPGNKFYTHNTKFLQKWLGRGSSAFVEKIDGKNSNNPANMQIYIDVMEDVLVPNYLRDSFGNYVPDGTGGYKVDATTPEITGMEIRFIKKFVDAKTDLDSYGNLIPIDGTMTDGVKVSRAYPFLEWRGSYRGSYYNNIGLGMNSYNQFEINDDLVKEMKAMVYGFKLYSRDDATKTAKVTKSITDGQSLDIVLKSNTRNPQTSAHVGLTNIFTNSYYNENPANGLIKYKDSENIFIYENYLEMILNKILVNEKKYVSNDVVEWEDGLRASNMDWFDYSDDDLIGDEYLINLFTGSSTKGVNYYSLRLNNSVPSTLPANTSIVTFTNNTPIFLDGGSDGDMTLEDMNNQTESILKEYSDKGSLRFNGIKYPGMFFVDSGYPLSVKYSMFNFIMARKDTAALFSTELYSDLVKRRYNLDNSIGIARALELRSMLAPESTVFNTEIMRGAMMLGSFETVNETEYTAQTYELMDYISELAGGPRWKREKMFDKDCYGRHGTKYHPDTVSETIKDSLWKLGLIVPEITEYGIPKWIGLCTMHPNSTSVGNNIFTMLALCTCERLAKSSYLDVGGDITSTNAEFIKLATDNLTTKHKGMFANVYKTSIDVSILGRDAINGNTYTVGTNLFGNVAKTGAYHSTKVQRLDAIPVQ